MSRFTNVGGMVPLISGLYEDADTETICEDCHADVDYAWYWYDDQEIDDIEVQVDDGEKSFEDAGMGGPLSETIQRQRFNALQAYYTERARRPAGAYSRSLC